MAGIYRPGMGLGAKTRRRPEFPSLPAALSSLDPALASSLSENSQECRFRSKGRMARHDDGVCPHWTETETQRSQTGDALARRPLLRKALSDGAAGCMLALLLGRSSTACRLPGRCPRVAAQEHYPSSRPSGSGSNAKAGMAARVSSNSARASSRSAARNFLRCSSLPLTGRQ